MRFRRRFVKWRAIKRRFSYSALETTDNSCPLDKMPGLSPPSRWTGSASVVVKLLERRTFGSTYIIGPDEISLRQPCTMVARPRGRRTRHRQFQGGTGLARCYRQLATTGIGIEGLGMISPADQSLEIGAVDGDRAGTSGRHLEGRRFRIHGRKGKVYVKRRNLQAKLHHCVNEETAAHLGLKLHFFVRGWLSGWNCR